ncbi:MAG TPA: glycosyltransferase [bacterium]|nr:glycosyltransferase [bacterium]
MSVNNRPSLDLCLPVYNEAAILTDNVERLVGFIRAKDYGLDCRIIILVNGSTDQSAKIAEHLSKKYPNLVESRVYLLPGKSRALLNYADTSSAEWWGFVDADLSISFESLAKLFEVIVNKSADLVIASRFLPESSCERAFYRGIVSALYNKLARHVLGTTVKDHQCGCKFVSHELWRAVRPFLRESDYFLDTALIAWAERLGWRIKEVPVDWADNRYGTRTTKVKFIKDTIQFLVSLRRLRRDLKSYRE